MRGNAFFLAESTIGVVSAQLRPVMVRMEINVLITVLPQGIKDRHPLHGRIDQAVGIGKGLIHTAGAQLGLYILRQLHTERIRDQHVI